MIGAVCGIKYLRIIRFSLQEYFHNVIKLAESIRDSTPIFEGSIAAFGMDAIKDKRIDEDVNADDSQLALLSKLDGFRSIVDPQVEFWEDSISVNRKEIGKEGHKDSLEFCFRHREYVSEMVNCKNLRIICISISFFLG